MEIAIRPDGTLDLDYEQIAVRYKCGHTLNETLTDRNSSGMSYRDCKACWLRKAKAAEPELLLSAKMECISWAPLRGSNAQVDWATRIRLGAVRLLKSSMPPLGQESEWKLTTHKAIYLVADASWWIDNRAALKNDPIEAFLLLRKAPTEAQHSRHERLWCVEEVK